MSLETGFLITFEIRGKVRANFCDRRGYICNMNTEFNRTRMEISKGLGDDATLWNCSVLIRGQLIWLLPHPTGCHRKPSSTIKKSAILRSVNLSQFCWQNYFKVVLPTTLKSGTYRRSVALDLASTLVESESLCKYFGPCMLMMGCAWGRPRGMIAVFELADQYF